MSELIKIEALYSPLTEYSPVQISSQQKEPCSHEIELYAGFHRKGFVCAAKTYPIGFLGVIKFYNPCQMNDGQCPIDQYQEFSLRET